MVSLNIEPAVTTLTYDVLVTDKTVLINNINTYGVKALFYINIDNAPKSKMFDLFEEGLAAGGYSFQGFNLIIKTDIKFANFSVPFAGDYTVTGRDLENNFNYKFLPHSQSS